MGPFEKVAAFEDVIERIFFRLGFFAFTFAIWVFDKPTGCMDVEDFFKILQV